MQIHCAFCGKPFEKDLTPPFGDVECPACNRTFDLSSKVTMPLHDAGQAAMDEGFPGKRYGGYRVEREIGRGGMGVVLEGVQESLDRKVAIKVLFRESCSDPQFVARFEREAESLARLNHPNIVTILDRGCQDGHYFFVMEHVDGVSLRAMMESGRLSPQQALAIIPPLCDALEYAHREGVIHRDIKPENILVDRRGRVKIADFGLSRIIRGAEQDNRITHSKMVMGTPDYMAPEQRENSKQVDHRADIYALGVVFYEMLTGELPLGKFPPPSRKGLQIDVRLDEIVLKVLDKDPDRRYQHASDIATDLAMISPPGKDGPGRAAAMPEWTPKAAASAAGPGADANKGKRTFLEIIEDGWDSWVLAVTLVLTIIDFFPFVALLVAWFALRKTVIAHKASRPAGGRKANAAERRIFPENGAQGGPPQAAQKVPVRRESFESPAAAQWTPVADNAPAASPHAPPAPPAPPAPKAAAAPSKSSSQSRYEDSPRPRLSFLAILSALYSLALLGAFIGAFLPFESSVRNAFLSIPIDFMPGALAAGACAAIPGVIGLLLSAVARSRISVHPHLGGQFLALLGLAGSVIFLGVAGRKWYDGYETYMTWSSLREKAAEGDADAVQDLIAHAKNPARRARALEAAGSLPPEQGLAFFAWAAGESGELGQDAIEAWAKNNAQASDPQSRKALIARIGAIMEGPAPESRAFAADLLEGLRGEDSAALLRKAAADKDAGVRRAAARVARSWKDPAFADLASRLALDEDAVTAMTAVEAIEELESAAGPEYVLLRFAAVARSSSDDSLRVRVLGRMKRMLARQKQGRERLAQLVGADGDAAGEMGRMIGELYRERSGETEQTDGRE